MDPARRERDQKALENNLLTLKEREKELLALEYYHVDEFARFLAYGCDEKEDFEDFYRRAVAEIPFFDGGVGGALPKPSLSRIKAFLFERLCFYARERGSIISLGDFFDTEELTEVKVTYVKNPMADEAYRVFSGVLGAPAVTYAPSFVSACEDVYYGRVSYCILPYENSDEGTLSGFMRLKRKYELYPQLVCACRGESGVTKFALFGREPCIRIEKKHKMMLRASFYSDSGQVISDVTSAAVALGLTLVKTESEAVPWDDGRYGQIITFGANAENVIPFLIYLSLEVPECSDRSVYYEVGSR